MLLDGVEFQRELFKAIESVDDSFIVFSAFIKEKALRHSSFLDCLEDKDVTVVCRWEKRDLIVGASDLEVYELCRDRGWRFGINLNLHGKLYLLDQREIFLGSANLTQKGLHIGIEGNFEFGTRISAGNTDLAKVRDFVASEVTWVDDDLYDSLREEVESQECEPQVPSTIGWSKHISDRIFKPVEYLWVNELVFSLPESLLRPNMDDKRVLHDFGMLEIDVDDLDADYLRAKFKKSRVFRWLHTRVEQEGSIHFGGITHALHNSVLDDPKPYRVDIKSYNIVLFGWAQFMDDTFVVSRPSHSQVLSLR
jgi:hypothetical protein